MRSLDLEFASLPRTMTYIRAYPNLSHLSYKAAYNVADDPQPLAEAECRKVHRINLDEQLNSGCTWKNLEQFAGSLLDLYALGLACTIDRLGLQGIQDRRTDMLETVLSYARPRRLELGEWPGLLKGDRAQVITRAEGTRLQHLSLRDNLVTGEEDVDIAAALENLRESFRDIPLQTLRLELCSTGLDPRSQRSPLEPAIRALMERYSRRRSPSPSPGPEDYPLGIAERSIQEFDLEDYLRRFAETVPSLLEATVIFEGLREERRGRKLVAKDGHVLQLEEVPVLERQGWDTWD